MTVRAITCGCFTIWAEPDAVGVELVPDTNGPDGEFMKVVVFRTDGTRVMQTLLLSDVLEVNWPTEA